MRAATARRSVERLLIVDAARGELHTDSAAALASSLTPLDLIVVNDAATLPAALPVRNFDGELRLARHAEHANEFDGVLFGAGDHRLLTERRALPPRVHAGERLVFDDELSAEVIAVDARAPRLVRVRFTLEGTRFWRALYRVGRPIQYAHVPEPLALWDVQNRFAARPWAFEPPSAGFALDGEALTQLAERGVQLAALTHAAGISSTGSEELDARLPFAERFEIPARTVELVHEAKRRRGRVIAVGTTVVRALEASVREYGELRDGRGEARLLLGPGYRPALVDGVLTGMHEPGTSHFALLQAFADRELLERALRRARRSGFVAHEFGDVCLVLGGTQPDARTGAARASRPRATLSAAFKAG